MLEPYPWLTALAMEPHPLFADCPGTPLPTLQSTPAPINDGHHEDSLIGLMRPSDEKQRQEFTRVKLHLQEILPAYMVPDIFLALRSMPFVAAMKVDRKTLVDQASALGTEILDRYRLDDKLEFVAAESNTEKSLSQIWSETLDIPAEAISIDDNFYRLGGDSIRIISLARIIHREYGVSLGFSQLNSKSTTIRSQARFISSPSGLEGQIDHGDDRQLNLHAELMRGFHAVEHSTITMLADKPLVSLPQSGAKIFLTGATGFLGTQILHHLLSMSEVSTVITLVRGDSISHATERVKDTACIAGWWSDNVLPKLQVWTGDLSQTRMGLSPKQWSTLGNQVDAIIHKGAATNWNADYESMYAANISSALDLLKAASSSPASPQLVYISGGAKTDINGDRTVVAAELATENGYVQSKFVAESLIHHVAQQIGTNQNRVSVIKPGLIIGTVAEGAANVDDYLWRLVTTASAIRSHPIEPASHFLAVAGADDVASTILAQLRLSPESVDPFIEMEQGMYVPDFWQAVWTELDIDSEPLPWSEWAPKALAHMDGVGDTHPLWPVQHFLGGLGVPLDNRRVESGNNTRSREAVRSNLRYLRQVGYISQEAGELGFISKPVISRSETLRFNSG